MQLAKQLNKRSLSKSRRDSSDKIIKGMGGLLAPPGRGYSREGYFED